MPVVKPTTVPETIKTKPRVLVVDDEPNLVELIGDVVKSMDCRIVTANSLAEARKVIAAQPVEVLVTDVHLPDGDGTTLLPLLHRRHPTASAIVITGAPSVDTAVSALRQGAVDFIPKPFTIDQLRAHVRQALQVQARAAQDERKLQRLRVAVRRLNEARKLISKKVDILCNDLITAYGELSRQVESVRNQEGFRKAIEKAPDLEQLLCHAMDWMLRSIGYANVAVWLAGEDGEFQLGAYMKYTVPGDPPVTAALQRVVVPLASKDNQDAVVRTKGADLRDRLSPQEFALLKGQDLLTINCTYLGESLAALVFFREEASPFTADDEALLKSIGPVFALALASVVRAVGDDEDEEDDNSSAHDGNVLDEEGGGNQKPKGDGNKSNQDKPKPKPKDPRDAADWWKRGEPPPF
jgi:FixJ family two-component response regulator